MELEKQVCSLELAKKLKELGVKQESQFWWYKNPYQGNNKNEGYDLLFIEDLPQFSLKKLIVEKLSAFTVAELGEMLPKEVKGFDLMIRPKDSNKKWIVGYVEEGWEDYKYRFKKQEDDFEANSRAKMLIYLKDRENKAWMQKSIIILK